MRGGLYSFLFINWCCQYPTKYSRLWLWVTGLRPLYLQILCNVLVANSHKFLHCLLQLPYAFHPRAKVQVLQWIMLLCPILETLGISYCQEGWLLSHILVGKSFQKEGTSIQTPTGWRHSVPPLQGCPQPDLQNIELMP